MSNKVNGLIEFGGFRLDPEKRILWFEDRPIHLRLKEIEVLSVLVCARGELVTKEELIERVWADSFVEDSNLSRQIYLLRKTFKDLGVDDLIETVPRRGYRFTGELRDAPNSVGTLTIEKYTSSQTLIEIEEGPDEPAEKAEQSRWRRHRLFSHTTYRVIAPSIAVLSAVLVGVLAFSAFRSNSGAFSNSGIRSVAVLPFRNIAPTGETSHEGLGLADLLITRLSNIKEVTVRPLGAVSGMEQLDPVASGRHLKTDAVLEGSIYRTDDKVRVTARLLKTADSSVVWTGEFERLLKDEVKLQDEIVLQVAEALAVNLSGSERAAVAKPYTLSADASLLYQKGRVAWNKRTAEGMMEAERLFRNAIEQDPNFALAYVGLADTFGMNSARNYEMKEAVRKALDLDPDLGEAYASLGFYEMFVNWEWRRAEEAFQKSIALSPNYATAHHWYAQLLAVQGRNEEAKAEMRRALEINPVSYNYLADLGQIYYFNREYAEAERYCRRALEIAPDFVFARFYLHQIYLKTGDYHRAVEEAIAGDKSANTTPNDSAERQKEISDSLERSWKLFREGGIDSFLQGRTSELQNGFTCYLFAQSYSFLGQTDKALACLEKSYAERAFLATFIKAEPAFDNLRTEPRYTQILRKMKLTE